MKSLYKYLGKYKKECILAPLFKMLEASFELIVPLVIASMIDRGIGGKDINYLFKSGVILLILAGIGLGCSITAQYFAAKAAVGFGTSVRYSLFKHILGFSFAKIDDIGTDTMINRMTNDINSVQSGVNMVLRLFLRSPFIVIGAMLMAFSIDIKAGWIFLIVIAILSVIVFGTMIINIPMLKKVQQGMDNILKVTRENLLGVRVIRAFCMEEKEQEEFETNNNKLVKLQKLASKISALMNPITYVVINLGVVVIIALGAFRVNEGRLTNGDVVALYNYMAQILVELIKLASLIITINKSLASSRRIEEVFIIDSSPNNLESIDHKIHLNKNTCSSIKIDKGIKFENVSMTYSGSKEPSLEDISFEVKSGQTLGIIGGTGAGKTSLVNVISGFYKIDKGEIRIGSKDVDEYSQEELREKISLVMQKSVLFKGTIRDNLRVGKLDANDNELLEALSIAQAMDVVETKGGLDAEITQGATNLSGGQRQRLAVARALVRKSDILILDDSSSALDFKTDLALRGAIKNLTHMPTTIIVSQRTTAVQEADIILVLDDGKIAGKGTHIELLRSSEVYKEIYYSQFKEEIVNEN